MYDAYKTAERINSKNQITIDRQLITFSGPAESPACRQIKGNVFRWTDSHRNISLFTAVMVFTQAVLK